MSQKRCFAVVHATSERQVLWNTAAAQNAGMHGAFLIAHGTMSHVDLMRCAMCARGFAPLGSGFIIGANFLDLDTDAAVAFAMEHPLDALWTDGTYLGQKPERFELFNGFAFKHQRQPIDTYGAARVAMRSCHVLTTSGPATGQAASIEKVQSIWRAADGLVRVGLASGVTPENVADYMPFVDDFLVATGINDEFDYIDPAKATRLAQAVRQSSAGATST